MAFMPVDLSYVGNLPTFAVAVSGGGDSMALVRMLAKNYVDKIIHAITVNHNMRENSAAEAEQVKAWLSDLPNVKHIILHWEDAKPLTGKMEAARDARYRLMAEYCREHGISVLALAHHGDDQTETFFMRLARGSGLDGLSGMRETRPYNEHLTLWRPLLKHSHEELLQYCREHNIEWVEDPTNDNPDYTRTRFRKLRSLLGDEGLSVKRMATTANRIARAQDALETLSIRLNAQAKIDESEWQFVYDLNKLKSEPFELGVRILREAIDSLGLGQARLDKVETIAQACLLNDADVTATLGGCIVQTDRRRGTLRIRRETNPKP